MKTVADFVVFLTFIVGPVTGSEWTDWSTWSGCSRTCGEGVSSQIRICNLGSSGSDETGSSCNGPGIRYRICSIQRCNGVDTDGVSDVCSALDDVTVGGKSFRLSSSDSATADDCYVSCLPTDGERSGEPAVFVVKANGTRCKMPVSPDSESALSHPPLSRQMNVCLTGVCQTVSCDDVVRSKMALDLQCEVCGDRGDGSKCSPPSTSTVDDDDDDDDVDDDDDSGPSTAAFAVYRWHQSGYSQCSTSCGIGQESAITTCREMTKDVLVSDEFCRLSSTAGDKPHRIRVCFGEDCVGDRAFWMSDEWGTCSASCGDGGGIALRSVYCVLRLDDGTYERSNDTFCSGKRRPIDERRCNDRDCPRWIAGQWSECSVSCGVGLRQRAVVCKRADGLDCDSYAKPHAARPCRQPTPCSSFDRSEIWNSESDSAALHGREDFFGFFDVDGKPIRDPERGSEVAEYLLASSSEQRGTASTTSNAASKRSEAEEEEEEKEEEEEATERTTDNPTLSSSHSTPPKRYYKSESSSAATQRTLKTDRTPVAEQRESGLNRPDTATTNEPSTGGGGGEDYSDLDHRIEKLNLSSSYDPTEAEYGVNDTDSEAVFDEYDDDDDEDLDGDRSREDEERKWLTDGAHRGGPPVESKEVKTVPSFVVSDWSRCSATCGTAKRRRQVLCKVLLEPSKIVHELPDFQCPGPKPETEDYCSLPECTSRPEPKTHEWMVTGYGPCSKTCGGGIQEGEFSCLRVPKYYKVDKFRCHRQPLPPPSKRLCNLHPCPPRWSPLPYGPCSASCGGGQQVRQFQCVQSTHDQKTKTLSDAQCEDERPPHTSAPCNLLPCPAKWVIGNWARCSATCGQGVQTRNVTCEQKLSPEQVVVVDDVSCWQQTDKPDTERTCEAAAGQCHAIRSRSKTKIIRSENSNFIQLKQLQQVPLTIGTNASLIAGTSIVIHCPLAKKKNANNNNGNNSTRVNRVVWFENGRPFDTKRHRRHRVDRHGALRIRNSRASDAGVYSCVAAAADDDDSAYDAANTTIRFHTIQDSFREMRTRSNLLAAEERLHRTSYSEDHMQTFQAELRRLFPRTGGGRTSYSGQFLTARMSTNLVPLQYVPFGWSQCSVECGGGGIQSRDVVCTIVAEDFVLEVDDGFCSDRRLRKPIADRDCGFGRCPHWEEGPWGQCGDDSCVQAGVGERRRELRCRSAHGERLDADRCRGQPRPKDSEDCQNDNCTAVWKPSNWTQCSITCGGRGIKTRSLQCVWRQSKKPVVGSVCLFNQRPPLSKSCYVTTPCPRTGCRDESKHCHMMPLLKMCRVPQYRQGCCLSCSLSRVSSPHQITSTRSVSLK